MQDRFHVAAALREIGRLLDVKGENPFKTRAYERGAQALENFVGDFDELVRSRHLTDIAGVGKALAAVTDEIYQSGESAMLQQLRDELPPGAVELSAIPGLTLKKIIAVHDALGIESVADLKTACEKGLVREVKGFGPKAEANILAAIEKNQTREERFLLDKALEEGQRILQYLRSAPGVVNADLAGALRRSKETVRQIDMVAATKEPTAVIEHFLRFPSFAHCVEQDGHRCLGRLANGLQAQLIIAEPSAYAAALHYWTGSRKHIAKVEQIARERGLTLGARPSGAADGNTMSVSSEEELYRRLNLQFIPPEQRENEGEIEAAAAGHLPLPLALKDVQGMVHCHTIYSDGQNTIEDMARAAEAMGMRYLTITDHSPSAFYARGVKIDRLLAQWEEIARVQEKVAIKLLKGTESDITQEGGLDYPDYILERFDVIIASIHARHKMNREQMTQRLLRALRLPVFKIWGHPLGRLIPLRPPFDCRMEEILDAIAESRAAVEVNGDPHRLDLEPHWIRAARERGIKFVVSTDAHSMRGLRYLQYGVAMARRGWLARDDVLNTLTADDFIKAVHP
jgi:DNA polymerase (family 10)